MHREELAYAGGLFDGEGSFYLAGRNRTTPVARIHMNARDMESLQRFHKAVGIGSIRHEVTRPEVAYWYVNGFEKVQAVVAMVWPWLNQRRRDGAVKVLSQNGE